MRDVHICTITSKEMVFDRKEFQRIVLSITAPYTGQSILFQCCISNRNELYAAGTIQKLKHPGGCIKLKCYLPYEGIANDWDPESRREFFEVFAGCDVERLWAVKSYTGCILECYQYMINQSDMVIIHWNNDCFGDTFKAMKYATDIGKKTLLIES